MLPSELLAHLVIERILHSLVRCKGGMDHCCERSRGRRVGGPYILYSIVRCNGGMEEGVGGTCSRIPYPSSPVARGARGEV